MKPFIYLFLLFPILLCAKEQSKIDSLQEELSVQSSDSLRFELLGQIGREYLKKKDYNTAALNFEKMLDYVSVFSVEVKFELLLVISECYKEAYDIERSLIFSNRAKDYAEEINNLELKGYAYNGIASIYEKFNLYDKSLNYHFKALKLREQINSPLIKVSLDGIGLIYKNIRDLHNAEIYFNKVLEIDSLDWTLQNLVHLYALQGNDSLALSKSFEFLNRKNKFKGFKIPIKKDELIKDSLFYLQRLSVSYKNLNKIDSALFYLDWSLNIARGFGDYGAIQASKFTMANIFLSQGRYDEALVLGNEILKSAQEKKVLSRIRDASILLYKLYKMNKDYALSLEMLEIYNDVKETLSKQYTAQKAQAAEFRSKIEAKEIKIQEKELQNYYTRIIAIIVSIVLILVAVLIYRNYRIKSKANFELAEINAILDEKNHDIMSNIEYAKKIQEAILPSKETILHIIPDSFNLYLPKDVVSGDFYWVHKDKSASYFAAVDCTGHGVSGAFMSIIGLTLLDELIVKQGIKELDKVLYEMREYIIKSLHQTGEAGEARDGMDIAICKLSGKKIEFAGAHNPLLIIRNKEIKEIKGDQQPIGFYTGDKAPFTKHEFDLEKGDMIYMFSDGYQDQFGGPKGKKYMAGKFKKLLLRISDQTCAEQFNALSEELQSWKGDYEQVDDICVMGVRV